MPKFKEKFEAYGSTIFCEDIRQESNGMITIVGAYMSNISVEEFPIVFPKFSFFTNVILPDDRIKEFNLVYQIYMPGDAEAPSVNIENVVKSERSTKEPTARDPEIPRHAKLLQHLVLSPLEIKQEGYIKVRVKVNDDVIKAGVIRISQEISPKT